MKSIDLVTLDEEDIAVARTISKDLRSAVSGTEVFQDPIGSWMILWGDGGISFLFPSPIKVHDEKPFTEHMMGKYPELFL